MTEHRILTSTMRDQIKVRWNSKQEAGALRSDSLEFWEAFFTLASQCPHLCGDNDRGWRAGLGWLTKRANFEKVLAEDFVPKGRNHRGIDIGVGAEDMEELSWLTE